MTANAAHTGTVATIDPGQIEPLLCKSRNPSSSATSAIGIVASIRSEPSSCHFELQCVPKIRFGDIGAEVHREPAVK
jgi:hypothetical protein